MPIVDVVVETKISRTPRSRQVESIFDVPPGETSKLEWKGDLAYEEREWNVGLIVGPSGSGKSTIGASLFGENFHPELSWGGASVIDDCAKGLKVQQISKAFSAVGFNTIPAWLRPYHVLSNGEKFRVELARRLLELPDPIVVDEFTSVVDRQVAKIGAHAVQKFVRRNERQFVALSCHYDIEDWLRPDWVFEVDTMTFRWRSLRQSRPALSGEICPVSRTTWERFAPYHYMSAELHRSARCFALIVDEQPVALKAVLHFPHAKVKNIKRISRSVTLPDWQGLGLGSILRDKLGAMYRSCGWRLRGYPAHPALIRTLDKSKHWKLHKKPGIVAAHQRKTDRNVGEFGGRPCAVFEYCGEVFDDKKLAAQIVGSVFDASRFR